MPEILSENGLNFVSRLGSCGECVDSYLERGSFEFGYHGMCLLKGGFC